MERKVFDKCSREAVKAGASVQANTFHFRLLKDPRQLYWRKRQLWARIRRKSPRCFVREGAETAIRNQARRLQQSQLSGQLHPVRMTNVIWLVQVHYLSGVLLPGLRVGFSQRRHRAIVA
jgi:hypothetical protein